jgi:hypothetical protein
MKYREAPANYLFWPSKYSPSVEEVHICAERERCDERTATIMLKGEAAARFLNDFPKEENLEASVERALALANLGFAQSLKKTV